MPQDTGVGRNVVLDGLDFASLRRVWEQTFGAAPPSSLSRVFMRRVLAYERQCRTLGWHSATTRRALAAMANGTPGNGAAAPAGSVSAGCPSSLLVRDWTLGPGPPSSTCWRAWSAREGVTRATKLTQAASRHSYRWCSPPTRGSATTFAVGDGRCVTVLKLGVSLFSPKWQRSS